MIFRWRPLRRFRAQRLMLAACCRPRSAAARLRLCTARRLAPAERTPPCCTSPVRAAQVPYRVSEHIRRRSRLVAAPSVSCSLAAKRHTELVCDPFLGNLPLESSHPTWHSPCLAELGEAGEEGLSLQELLADGAALEVDASRHSLDDPGFACFEVATACRS